MRKYCIADDFTQLLCKKLPDICQVVADLVNESVTQAQADAYEEGYSNGFNDGIKGHSYCDDNIYKDELNG